MTITSFPGPCNAQKGVEQKSTGNRSPNIYAPGGNITIIYDNSGNFSELQSKLDDAIKAKETLSKEKKELERKLAEITALNTLAIPPNNGVKPLIKFTPEEFIDNFIRLHEYNQYRKSGKLLNPDKLIEVLDGYFRSVLLYPLSSTKKYYITDTAGRISAAGSLLLLQMEGHTKEGEKQLLSIPDISASLLSNVCNDFVKSADSRHYDIIINLFDRANSTQDLDSSQKMNILDAKTFIQKIKLLSNM